MLGEGFIGLLALFTLEHITVRVVVTVVERLQRHELMNQLWMFHRSQLSANACINVPFGNGSWMPIDTGARSVDSGMKSSLTPPTSCRILNRRAKQWCPTGWHSASYTIRRLTGTSWVSGQIT